MIRPLRGKAGRGWNCFLKTFTVEPLQAYTMTLKQRRSVLVILIGFFCLFACISLVNHFLFRTYGWDLAYFNKAIFDYSEFRLNRYDIWWNDLEYTLGDHFEPIMFIIAPLRYIFGQYTLLLVQIFALLFGGYGAFIFVRCRTEAPWLPHLAMIHFLSIWGVYSALAFDYHNNVVGAMFLPWLVHYFGKGNFKAAGIFLLLLLMSKENMAIWGVFIMLGLTFHYRKDRQKLKMGVAFTVFSGLYFVLVMQVILPAFQPEGITYKHFKYSILGEGFGGAIKTLITRPLYAFHLLYTNHIPEDSHLDPLKLELYQMILLSGGLFLLVRPQYLLMTFPIIGQKVFSDKPGTWGINGHYCIELVPILSLAVFSWIINRGTPKLQYTIAIAAVLLTLGSTFYSFRARHTPYYRATNQNVFSWNHWKQDEISLIRLRKAIKMVPSHVPVSASNTVLPHLSMRDKAYMFPRVEDAEYVVITRGYECYPSTPEEVDATLLKMKAEGSWKTLMDEGKVVVLQRIGKMPN